MAAKKTDSEQLSTRIRIKIKAYDNKVIDQSARKIVETAERSGSRITGPVPLPTEIHKMTVNKSTFVYKDSRDQYEMRIHKRLIDLPANEKVLHNIMRMRIPKSVNIKIEMKD